MKILMVSAAILPWETHGVSVHVDQLVRELSRHHHLTLLYTSPVVPTGDKLVVKENHGIREVWVPDVRAKYDLRFPDNTPGEFIGASISMTQAWSDLQRFLRAERFDLVHIHDYYASLFIELVRETVDCPIVVTVHSLSRDSAHFGTGLRYWMLQQADAVIAVSEDLRSRLQDVFGRSLECTVIPNGIKRHEIPRSEAKKYLSFVGRLERDKGCDVLLDAIKALGVERLTERNLTVQILGDGSELEALKCQSSKAHLDKVVHFQGHVPHETVYSYLGHSALHLVPSRNESFGLSAAEALMAGVPVLASRVGGLVELCSGNPLARLVDPDDVKAWSSAIEKMLDQDFSVALREQARAMIIENYAWDKIAARTVQVYEKVIDARGQRGSAKPMPE